MKYSIYDKGSRILHVITGKTSLYHFTVDAEIRTRAAVYTRPQDSARKMLETLNATGHYRAEKM